MKTFKQIREEAVVNSVGSGTVAGVTDNSRDAPIVGKKKPNVPLIKRISKKVTGMKC
jgi:hypothetical protein